MGCEYICDNPECGKKAPAGLNHLGHFIKPHTWYSRTVEKKTEVACSRECIEAIGGLVAPW